MTRKPVNLDRFDLAILDVLSVDGRLSITDLAARIGLSKSPTQARLRRLEHSGVIRGYRVLVDPILLGRDHVAFAEIKLTDTREAALSAFNAAVARIGAIEECHLIAGNFDYLLKVRCGSMSEYRHLLADEISRLPHVAQSSTYMAMQAIKEEATGESITAS